MATLEESQAAIRRSQESMEKAFYESTGFYLNGIVYYDARQHKMNKWTSCQLPKQEIPDNTAEYKKQGLCPKCGDKGEWRMMALVCRQGHGRFAG